MSNQQFSLRWNNYTNYITCAFESLRYEEDLVDVTLCCEGKKIRAHKILLSACSAYFKEIFKENPCQHPVIIFKNVKHADLLAIVEFMYQGEVSVIQESLPSFLHTAELLSIRGLTDNTGDSRAQQHQQPQQQQQQQQPQPQTIQQHIIHTQPQNLLEKTITTAESVYLTLPSSSTIVHHPAKLIQTQPATQIINKTIIKPITSTEMLQTTVPSTSVPVAATLNQTLTTKLSSQTDFGEIQQVKRKKIKLQSDEEEIFEPDAYSISKSEADDNQGNEDDQVFTVGEEEYQETTGTALKMEIPEYIDSSQITDQLNASNAGTTYIQDERYELVDESIQEKDEDGNMQHDNMEMEGNEMDMSRIFQGTSDDANKSNILQDIVCTNKWSQCQICKLVITSVNLWRHMRTQHTNQEPKRCDRCNKQFKNKYSLREHVRMAHENKQQQHQPQATSSSQPETPTQSGSASSPPPPPHIGADFETVLEKKSIKLY